MVDVRIKLLAHGARVPEYAKAGDAGCDLRWFEPEHASIVMRPDETRVLWCGIAIELPDGWEAQIRPRSSLSSKGARVALGTIDSGYRGQIGVTLFNASREMQRFERGDRIAQLVFAPSHQAVFEVFDELADSQRGVGGWGSSGLK